MPNWNLSATIAFRSGQWTSIELVKDELGFRSSGPVGMLALPEFCEMVEQLGLKAHGYFSSKKVKMVVYRLSIQDGKDVLMVSGGTMGHNKFGKHHLGKIMFHDDDFCGSLPVVCEAGSS